MLGSLQMVIDLALPFRSRGHLAVVPPGNQFFTRESGQMLCKLVAKVFVLVGVGVEELGRHSR